MFLYRCDLCGKENLAELEMNSNDDVDTVMPPRGWYDLRIRGWGPTTQDPNEEYHLCDECFPRFQEFLSQKPEKPSPGLEVA